MELRHKVTICLGSSCFSRGNRDVLELIRQFLKDNDLEGQVDFRGDLCSHHCSTGPIVVIDGQIYENVDQENIFDILNEVFRLELLSGKESL